MILGLDISTSCTGWSILSDDGKLVQMGAINLSRFKTLFSKAEHVAVELSKINFSYDVSSIFIEENLQAFRPGLSSAKTLLTLARFNGVVSYLARKEFSLDPYYINVNVARKTVGLKIISKKKGGKPTKEQVLDWSMNKISFVWPKKILKSGPRKGLEIFDPSCFDMADAYVIALAGHLDKINTKKL